MSKTQRTPAFKKKIVLEALREEKTLIQIGSEYGVHPVQITKWKRELLDGMEAIFSKKGARQQAVTYRKILVTFIDLMLMKNVTNLS